LSAASLVTHLSSYKASCSTKHSRYFAFIGCSILQKNFGIEAASQTNPLWDNEVYSIDAECMVFKQSQLRLML
jgi:hypothetical protein